ncbi:pentapeptide repeat-containing protein [Streptomyces sp. SID14478]|uniref:pentapeptide repeat-containing protein n=1 Tax=Streptomyces sp. SID14478 TaxID=2706073 RepID=UPI0013DA6398|nr:pentapeptide repeat-containing protein [Streptomyces sp. SID14478]NEB78990.1 pentapeptide repeat-containing protein [Streptomyces sp. SID14478]
MGSPSPRRRRTERRGLRLWPVGSVLALAFTIALLVAGAVFYTGWDVLGAREVKREHRLDSATLFDLVKLSFGVVAGAGALVALVVAYRRQRIDEDGALRESTRLHTERFTTAVSQLGDNSAAVRLGGVHALAGLADDAPIRDLRQTSIDVLCAYLRLPYTAESELPADNAELRHAYLGLREVRHTVIRVIRDHLRLAPGHQHSWRGHDFDLTHVTFDGGDFSGTVFSGGIVDFSNAIFRSGTVTFHDAEFSGGTVDFSNAAFCNGTVTFQNAEFSGGKTSFHGADFEGGTVDFTNGAFSGGTVTFDTAIFGDGTVTFHGAEFSGSRISFRSSHFDGGIVTLLVATFSGGIVDFRHAEFSGGGAVFNTATFTDGTVTFHSAIFHGGSVDFRGAHFSGGSLDFNGAVFDDGGMVDFRSAIFSDGRVAFYAADFDGGTVDFRHAEFSGGTVDFSGAVGEAPPGLMLPSGPPPGGVSVPPAWAT